MFDDFKELLSVFNAHSVKYLIVGGYAVSFHAQPRATKDRLYDFPEDQLTVVVLTNTEGQNAYAIARALARAVFKLPELPAAPVRPEGNIADNPVSAAERGQLTGTFVLTA